MGNVTLAPAEHKHIGRIARRMRAIDEEECTAMGRTAKQALRLALGTSDRAYTAMVDGQPEAMFGLVVESALTGDALPWFLGTDEVYRHGRELVRWGPSIVNSFGDSRLTLRNLVSSRNDRAIRLLRRWGFTVFDEEIAVRGVAFRKFEKRAS